MGIVLDDSKVHFSPKVTTKSLGCEDYGVVFFSRDPTRNQEDSKTRETCSVKAEDNPREASKHHHPDTLEDRLEILKNYYK